MKLLLSFCLVVNSFLLHAQSYPFNNVSLPAGQRVEDLIKRLTVDEKIGLIGYTAAGVKRLNIPMYNWWNEALHGVARAGKATVFPQAIGLAATFDDALVERVADAISTEARAKYNAGIKNGNRDIYFGLTFWSPNINIFRDPRWGRGHETYGEDPYLTGTIGSAFVKGIQGNDPKYFKAVACAKHFAIHSGPEPLRHGFNAVVSASDLYNTYLPAFKKLVTEAKVGGVMCAYNAFEKVPCCANKFLLQDILRKEWGFKGYIVTDCWAITDFYSGHKYVPTSEEAISLAVKNTVNVECGQDYKNLKSAVTKKLVTEKEIDAVLRNNLEILFKLGWFDDPKLNPFNTVSETEVDSEKNRRLARETAAKSIVLLSNKKQVLPLKNDLKRIALVGPNANNLDVLLANYNGISGNLVTFYEGLTGGMSAGTYLDYEQGCNLFDSTRMNLPSNLKSADAVIAVMGLSPLLEGEDGETNLAGAGGDKKSIQFPEGQIKYLKKLKAQINKPLIVVLTGGSTMELKEVEELADAVILAWYPGEEGGNAAADVLFGKTNPAGRLPLTFYKSNSDLPDFKSYEMKGRTYRYFDGAVQHPFGFGLSYTNFTYQNLKVDKQKDHVLVSFSVKNDGAVDGEEVPQLYIHHSGTNSPIKELKAFQRVLIKKGETAAVTFKVPYSEIQFWEEPKKEWTIFSDDYDFMVGSSSADIKLNVKVKLK